MHICCRRDHPVAIKVLLRVADAYCLDAKSQTALHVAAGMGHVHCVNTLLACKASPNGLPDTDINSPDTPTPLEVATLQHRWPAVVVALLAGGADPNTVRAKGSGGKEPQGRRDRLLFDIITKGDEELCQIFIENGAFAVDETLSILGVTALQHATHTGNLGMVQLLVRQGAGVNLRIDPSTNAQANPLAKFTPLEAAALCGKMDILTELLAFGGDEDEANQALLPHGIMCDKVLRSLNPTGASEDLVEDMHRVFSEEVGHLPERVTRRKFLSWMQSARSGALGHMFGSKMFKDFVDMELLGLDPSRVGTVGVSDVEARCVRYSFMAESYIERTRVRDHKLMFYAAAKDDARALEILLVQQNRSPEVFNDAGLTPLAVAALNNSVNAAQKLLSTGNASVDMKTKKNPLGKRKKMADQVTPLAVAAGRKHVQMVQLLLRSKANPNGRSALAASDSLLAQAVVEGDTEIVEALVHAANATEDGKSTFSPFCNQVR